MARYMRAGPNACFRCSNPICGCFEASAKPICRGTLGSFNILRNYRQLTAFEQAELILYAALKPDIASKAKMGDLVKCLDHFDLLQNPIN